MQQERQVSEMSGKIKIGTLVRVVVPIERFQGLPNGHVIPNTYPEKYAYEVEFPMARPPAIQNARRDLTVTYYFHEGEIVPVEKAGE